MAEQKQLNINIAPDKQQGVFANLALIAHTPTEFVFDFAQLMPGIQQANGWRFRITLLSTSRSSVLSNR